MFPRTARAPGREVVCVRCQVAGRPKSPHRHVSSPVPEKIMSLNRWGRFLTAALAFGSYIVVRISYTIPGTGERRTNRSCRHTRQSGVAADPAVRAHRDFHGIDVRPSSCTTGRLCAFGQCESDALAEIRGLPTTETLHLAHVLLEEVQNDRVGDDPLEVGQRHRSRSGEVVHVRLLAAFRCR